MLDAELLVPVAMLDELENEFLPLFVIGGMNEVLVDFGEEDLRFEAEAENWFCFRREHRIEHFVEGDPVIFAPLRVEVKKFLDKDTDGLWTELGDLVDMGVEHWFVGEAALAEGIAS